MDPRSWSPYRTLHALREAGITPKVHPDGDRLALPKGQGALLTEDLRAALKANHADLLRGALFLVAVSALIARLEHEGLGDEHPAREAAYRALGEDGAEERADDAWTDGDLDDFKAALAAWASPAYRALEAALGEQRRHAAARPAPPAVPAHPDSDERALFTDGRSRRHMGAA